MKKYNERSQSTRRLGDILAEITGDPALNRGIGEARALKAWEEVVGASVARITTKVYLSHGVYYVNLNSSIIRSELMMHKEKIIEDLNRAAGSKIVRDLVLR